MYKRQQLLVCPILDKKDPTMNRTVHRFFIPDGIWYDFRTGKKFPGNKTVSYTHLSYNLSKVVSFMSIYWIILFLVLLLIELATVNLVSIWFAIGSRCV